VSPGSSSTHALRRLQSHLLQRRFAALEPRFRLELLGLGLLVGAFVFWQMRVAMDGVLRSQGTLEVARFLGVRLAILVVVAGVFAGARLFRMVRRTPPGPAWLTLPLPPNALLGHLGWEARLVALVVAAGAPGFFAAAWGLLPFPTLIGIALAFAAAMFAAAHTGTAIAGWLALAPYSVIRSVPRGLPPMPQTHTIPPLTRALSEIRVERGHSLPAARWGRTSVMGALVRKDLRLATRYRPIQVRLIPALAGIAFAAAAWQLPMPLDLARFVALALALLTAWQAADALIALSGADPFLVLRGLPVGAARMWATRAGWALVIAVLVVASQAPAAWSLSHHARTLYLVWTGLACLAIVLLGVHYGLTLFPRADAAARMLQLSLSLAMIASLMIPLLGWIILLTAVIHSARRVPRWSRIEALP
jgi:hypothetical protein